MENWKLIELHAGLLEIIRNSLGLLEEAKLLRDAGRMSRSYALAYTACEEFGKITMLLHAAVKVTIDIPVDWKKLRQRFHSHDSKAAQFTAATNAFVTIFKAKTDGTNLEMEDAHRKMLAGVLAGPDLFKSRNDAFYCSIEGRMIVSPQSKITPEMLESMLARAEVLLITAGWLIPDSKDDFERTLRVNFSRQKHDSMMASLSDFLDSALSNDGTE